MKTLKSLLAFYLTSLLIFIYIINPVEPVSNILSTDENEDIIDLPILMYHGLTDKPNHVNDYFILADTFENDLRYLKSQGYNSVTMNQVIDFVEEGIPLPSKPVVLTFDDGYCNNYNLGSPLLEKYNMKAVLSVIGKPCQIATDAVYRSEDYCNVTWQQLKTMNDSGLWSIENHTYNLHELDSGRKGASLKKGESPSEYKRILKHDLSKLQNLITGLTGVPPRTFTWPFGAVSSEGDEVIKSLGFRATLSCSQGINEIKIGDPSSLHLMKRNLRTPKANIDKLLK